MKPAKRFGRRNRKSIFESRSGRATRRKRLRESIEYTDEMNVAEYRDRAWSGAKDTLEDLSDADIEAVFDYIKETESGELPTLSYINDFFWFERDTIAEILGYDSYDELMNDQEN